MMAKKRASSRICPHCKGNGYVRVSFEAEESILQCQTCESKGELDTEKFYHQTWTEPHGTTTYYHGPLVDPEEFKDWKIHHK
jgi:DnaJ-class molecular chaperone